MWHLDGLSSWFYAPIFPALLSDPNLGSLSKATDSSERFATSHRVGWGVQNGGGSILDSGRQ